MLSWSKLARQLKAEETAERTWAEISPRLRRNINAFCAGLNDYRAKHPEECKDVLEATPIQILAWGKFFIINPSVGIALVDADSTLAGTDKPVFNTEHSSTWVAGPQRTAEKAPIVLIDPHWPAQGIFSFYEAHLHAGKLDAGANMSECMRATCLGILNEQGRFIFGGGQVVTTVVSLTNPIQVYSIVPYGQSLKPDSKHYSDQMPLYSDDRMRPAWHDWEQLKENIESSETVTYTHAQGKKP